MLTILIAIAVVAVLALLMRAAGKSRDEQIKLPDEVEAAAARLGAPAGEDSARQRDAWDAADDDDDEDSAAPASVTSDGWTFVLHGRDVRLMPPANPESADESHRIEWRGPEHLVPGDLIGARVKRGAPDIDPWRLEALGRDRDYRAWPFETEEAARAALAMVEHVVRPPRNDDGETAALRAEDFELARVEHQRTEEELASMPEDEGPSQDR